MMEGEDQRKLQFRMASEQEINPSSIHTSELEEDRRVKRLCRADASAFFLKSLKEINRSLDFT